MGELSSSLPNELNFLLKGRAPGKRQVKPVSVEQAKASLAWVKGICGDDDDDEEAESDQPFHGATEMMNATADDFDELDEEEASEDDDDDEGDDVDEDDGNENDDVDNEELSEQNSDQESVTATTFKQRLSKVTDESDNATSVPAGLSFLLKTRAPGKRKVKPVSAEKAAILAELGGSDEDDEDFQYNGEANDEDHSGSDDLSEDSDSDYTPLKNKKVKKKGSPNDSDIEITKVERVPMSIDLDALDNESSLSSKAMQDIMKTGVSPKLETLVCLVCLKENNDDPNNELVQCDGCGIACHILCYGIGELSDDGVDSGRSTPLSTASTEPWFCDSCRAAISKPSCQLCPNEGGAFKQTDSGHWVHLICALYTGCSFGEVRGLSSINVNSIKQKHWGSRACTLCPDPQFACTGVCISCDAGMCRMVFHVTCAQKEGLLAEAPVAVAASVLSSALHSPLSKMPKSFQNDYSSDEETRRRKHSAQLTSQDIADPFYACCKRHSNPEATKKSKRNCLAAFRICATFKQEDRWELAFGQTRFERKLHDARKKFFKRTAKASQTFELTITNTIIYQSRPVTSCPAFVRRALLKAKRGDVHEEQFVMSPTANTNASASAAHYAPLSFTSRFIQYFEARNRRIEELQAQLSSNKSQQRDITGEEAELKKTYEVLFQSVRRYRDQSDRQCSELVELHSTISELIKKYFGDDEFDIPSLPAELGVEARDRKAFENDLKETAGITMHECSVCKQTRDQHMLMQCGTCERRYHCFCLDPPLAQPWTAANKPVSKRNSAKWSWECHFCCPSTSDSDVVKKDINVDAPRQLRREIKAPVRFIVSSENNPSEEPAKGATSSKDANGRNNAYTAKGNKGTKGGQKRARANAEPSVPSESPTPKQIKHDSPLKTPPLKLKIPPTALISLQRQSPTKPADPKVYDFSSESNE